MHSYDEEDESREKDDNQDREGETGMQTRRVQTASFPFRISVSWAGLHG